MINNITLNNPTRIWVCSDWHFNHDKDFIWKARGFESIEQMNNAIIKHHNAIVRPDEDVYVLGDLMLGGVFGLEAGLNLIAQLNGRLHLIRGNHDTNNRWTAYSDLQNVIAMENSVYLKYQGYFFYMSHFPSLTGNNDKFLKQMTLNLFGHTHQTEHFYEDKPYMYNVAMDAHNCYPCDLNDIIQEIKAKFAINQKIPTDGITPHDACVKPNIPTPYEAFLNIEKYVYKKCATCIYYSTRCPGPTWLETKCPNSMEYSKKPSN